MKEMTILNLKTFINNTAKKGSLYYYNNVDYHIFTNGRIAYGIRKGTTTNLPVKHIEELSNNCSTIELRIPNSLDKIVNIYKNGKRKHVTNYKDSFINNSKTVNVFTDMWNNTGYVIIDRRYKNCCKSTNKCVKDCFIIKTEIKNKETSLYFESTLNDDEFILIMPIQLRKG